MTVDCDDVKTRERLELPSPVKDKVVLTARSLFLNQNVSYSPLAINNDSIPWNSGSYTERLRINSSDLKNWKGKKLLDLAEGPLYLQMKHGKCTVLMQMLLTST